MPASVSIIIPCYNYARFLRQSVRSALAQTAADLEIIIVDDGSTDDTLAVAQALAESQPERVRVIATANTGQPACSRNQGILAARGEYILPLDADDVIAPGYVAACLDLFARRPEIGLAYCDYQNFGGQTNRFNAKEYNVRLLALSNFIPCCSMFRRRDWQVLGGYRTNLAGYEDWDFWLGLAELSVVGRRIPEPLFYYRNHGQGLYSRTVPHHEKRFAALIANHPRLYPPETVAQAEALLGVLARPVCARPKVSVLVDGEQTPEALAELGLRLTALPRADWEVWLVGSGPTHRLLESIVGPERLGVIKPQEDWAMTRNLMLHQARGEFLLALRDPASLTPKIFTEALVEPFCATPSLVCYPRRLHRFVGLFKNGEGRSLDSEQTRLLDAWLKIGSRETGREKNDG